MKKYSIKFVSLVLMLTLALQVIHPIPAFALTTGPSQPEVQAFEPVGTTEMVDMFSGDFVYNVPLMDVDGYPINLSYHSGIGMEQEASWVGLGWSLNPGEINRSVRGIPDDFKGDQINKELHVNPEHNFMSKVGIDVGSEILGLDLGKYIKFGVDASLAMNYNNYKGISASFRAGIDIGVGPSTGNPGSSIKFSPSIGVGSQSGVDLDASIVYSNSQNLSKLDDASVSLGVGSGINSRNGISHVNFFVSSGTESKKNSVISASTNESVSVPIGLQNYVPVITNATRLLSFGIQLKIGGAVEGVYPNLLLGCTYTQNRTVSDGTRNAYGYMYLEEAPSDKTGILDFVRDKDGIYNKTINNLPLSSLAYDVYNVSGQGTGGSFRPFRNDIGTIYDPVIGEEGTNASLGLEIGAGAYFEIGGDAQVNHTTVRTGPWLTADFQGERPGTLYEKLFYKQAGELTYNRQLASSPFYGGTTPLDLKASYHSSNPFVIEHNVGDVTFSNTNGSASIANGLAFDDMENGRTARANVITPLTATQASMVNPQGIPVYSTEPSIYSYYGHNDVPGTSGTVISSPIDRSQSNLTSSNTDLKDRISYVSQTLPDGRRYVYGIPAYNNTTEDVIIGMDGQDKNYTGGLVNTGLGSTPSSSNQGPEQYFSRTTTPPYAHSYLLTEVLSPDYVDITGNGCSDDDLGGFVKLNYTRTSRDYRWRSPAYNIGSQSDITSPSNVSVHFDPGFQSDPNDGKGSVSMGSREQWYVHSIESKNLIADFYISPRNDARGMTDGGLASKPVGLPFDANHPDPNSSYELDSIRLFNKNERIQLGSAAVPIKTVIFQYDYSLCYNTPNSAQLPLNNLNPPPPNYTGKGKLTLKKLFIRYGNSDKNLLNPYQFTYATPNPPYSYEKKDRWGYNNTPEQQFSAMDVFEFPYTSQQQYNTTNTDPATSYNLSQITLPSGGNINVEYEPDDYAYVQDHRATQMVKLEGLGSDTKFHAGASLYEGDNEYNYLYFKRDQNKEFIQNATTKDQIRKIYLENETHLYYSVSTDIRGGAYEQIKGFGEIVDVDKCSDDPTYGYVMLKKVNSNSRDFSPVTLYAMNYAKWNLNHIVYPGYGSTNPIDVLKAFGRAFTEIGHMSNPLLTFVEYGYCKGVNLNKSWIRLQSAGLRKKGGGVRVKRLTINDNWGGMNANSPQTDGSYGKEYDYTIDDNVYGRISSGVASYEPLVGGDENPLRSPDPYIAAQNAALPAMTFYQLKPLGENFYPGGSVGYSSVKVRSIHINEGKSSMSEEDNQFYTAKDYPVRVEYTNKNTNSIHKYALVTQASLEQASQGYTLFLNDMHGKPKAKYSYVVTNYDNTSAHPHVVSKRPVNGIVYHYNESSPGQLSSMVKAFRLNKGSSGNPYTYVMEDIELGKETDLSFDSRQNFDEVWGVGAAANLNVMDVGIIPLPVLSIFPSFNMSTTVFHSMVGTKIVQQYGILKSVDTYEEEAKTTTTENLVYDAESGNVLLSRTTNEFNDNEYAQKLPAYLAYESMGPTYSNIGFKDQPTSIYVNRNGDGFMDVVDKTIYSEGDELLYNQGTTNDKLWITNKGNTSLAQYYGFNDPNNVCLAFFTEDGYNYNITINGSNLYTTSQQINGNNDWNLNFIPGSSGNYIQLPPGNYSISMSVYSNNNPVMASTNSSITINATSDPLQIYSLKYCNNTGGHSTAHNRQTIPTGFGPFCVDYITDSKCFLTVNTRYKNIHLNQNATNTNWWMSGIPKFLNGFSTEIVRSGRRNMLGADIQSSLTSIAPNLSSNTLDPLLPGNGVISVSAQTYTNAAQPYDGFDHSLVPVSGTPASTPVYEGLNDYVTGLKGNFRPYEQYTAFADRTYGTSTHSRRDGLFNLPNGPYWTSGIASTCVPWALAFANGTTQPNIWKKASTVTKYDMFGNALEETDALGIYSTALYGYGQRLPIAVASNAQQQSILYESFEEQHSLVIPDVIARMFHSFSTSVNLGSNSSATTRPATAFFHSTFSSLFSALSTTLGMGNQTYFKTANSSGQPTSVITVPVTTSITGTGAHTGTKALSVSGAYNFPLAVTTAYSTATVGSFSLLTGNNYLVDLWVKRANNSTTVPAVTVQFYGPYGASVPLSPVGMPIEGWQLMEGKINLSTSATQPVSANLSFGGSMLVDDIRIMPMSANMKSFVYDINHNNRLSAELDANHYATYYEYDQEGQLIRVKKETEKGIVTISESRRALKTP